MPIGIICCHRGASVIESWLCEEDCNNPELYLDINQKHQDHTFEEYSKWNKPSYMHNEAFDNITPFSLDGAVWYQGESDTTVAEAKIYPKELEALINCWRKDLMDDKLPFVIIQIADYDGRRDEGWTSIQQAQIDACESIVNTYLLESRDICSSWNIHPQEKEKLGLRIADKMYEILSGN